MLRRVLPDRSGLAMIEFCLVLPIILLMSIGGAELTNYVTTRMRISQVALHVADNAARMGVGTQLTAKSVSERDINDVLTGGGLQAGSLHLFDHGRVIISDLEADPDNIGRYQIKWQRCRGSKTAHGSNYGSPGDKNLSGIGPSGRQVTAQVDNATMFVEVYYEYKPLVNITLAPSLTIVEVASMAVRDRRDLSQVYNIEQIAPSAC